MTGLSLSSPCSLPSLTPLSPERPLTTTEPAKPCLAQTSLQASSLATLFLPASSVTISPSKSSSRPPSRETS